MLATTTAFDNAPVSEAALEAWYVTDAPERLSPLDLVVQGKPVSLRSVPANALTTALSAFSQPARLAALFVPGERVVAVAAAVRRDSRYDRTRIYPLGVGAGESADPLASLTDDWELDLEPGAGAQPESLDDWRRLLVSAFSAFVAMGDDPAYRRLFLDTKYNAVFSWFERTRWDWNDLPDLAELDRERLTPEFLAMVKHSAIAEFGTLPGAHNFLREWHDEVSFSNWALAWGAEESRHSLLLARYLKAAGLDLMTKHALYKRKPYAPGPTRASTLMMNIISESRAAESYLTLATAAPEPISRKIFRLLGKDEARHASAFAQFCRELCEADEQQKVSAMEQAYYWLAQQAGGGFRHPAGEFYRHTQTAQGFSHGEQAFGRGAVDAGDRSVIRMIRRIVQDDTIHSARDVKRWLREHH